MIIGVTGNIASGKSTAAALLKSRLGATIVDADSLGHYLLERNPDIRKRVVIEFGSDILDEDGEISRKKLSDKVFTDLLFLSRLNTIFYPYITYEVRLEILRAQKMFNHTILDAALILEWGMKKDMDSLIVVTAPYEVRLKRLMERRRLLEDEAEKRINAQASEEYKIAAADIIVNNVGTIEDLEKEIDGVVLKLEQKIVGLEYNE